MCVRGEGGREGGREVCVGVTVWGLGVIVWVGVGMIAWVWKGVCGWYSLNCCCKVCMCVRGEGGREGGREVCVGVTVWGLGVIVWVGVGMIAWVWKGVCGWYSLNCCCKVCMCVGGGGREGGSVGGLCVNVIVWVCGCDCVGGCGCDCVGVEGSVWVVQS